MYKTIWKKVREDKIFIADFWNSGTASDGCMAAARGGGYFYIMWDGTITSCIIRDNSKLFYKIVEETGAIPVDEGAKTYLSFIEKEQMPDYNRRYNELSDPIWNKEYLKKT